MTTFILYHISLIQYQDYDSDFGDDALSGRNKTDIDPYAGIFFSKDRKEEVIEVEETPEYSVLEESGSQITLMTQGEWMKGCPEGGEQGFLFSLYQSLTSGTCSCPYQCGSAIERKKSDMFALHVRTGIFYIAALTFRSQISRNIFPDLLMPFAKRVRSA